MDTIFFSLCLTVATCAVLKEVHPGIEYERFVEIPGGDGMHVVDLEAEPNAQALEDAMRNGDRNEYYLYTRNNLAVAQELLNTADSIRNSNFNPNHPTVVIAHGWLSSHRTEPNPTIRNAFLNRGNYNIISVDWRHSSRLDYISAVLRVPNIGQGIGQFLAFLNKETGAPFTTMHLTGFSLGAHIVGNAGREVQGQVARITGLDPAGPLWNLNRSRLRATDGVYVEAIHTDGGFIGLGLGSPLADVDFFPIGGNSQPGCITNLCNHNRAWELFATSINYNHLIGIQCANVTQISANTCNGTHFPLGNQDLEKRGSGKYRINTARAYPF